MLFTCSVVVAVVITFYDLCKLPHAHARISLCANVKSFSFIWFVVVIVAFFALFVASLHVCLFIYSAISWRVEKRQRERENKASYRKSNVSSLLVFGMPHKKCICVSLLWLLFFEHSFHSVHLWLQCECVRCDAYEHKCESEHCEWEYANNKFYVLEILVFSMWKICLLHSIQQHNTFHLYLTLINFHQILRRKLHSRIENIFFFFPFVIAPMSLSRSFERCRFSCNTISNRVVKCACETCVRVSRKL